MINVDDELLHIDNEYSETEIFLKYGVVSLMFYEPTPYIKLIVAISVIRLIREVNGQMKN